MVHRKQIRKPGGARRRPGVYVEEVSSGARPIEGVGTAVAAFVGLAQRHPAQAAAGVVVALSLIAVIVRVVRA